MSIRTGTASVATVRTGTFSATGPMAESLASHTATLLPDGRVLIAVGFDGWTDVAWAELYDPRSGTFKSTGSGG
jgi:hypothetical protein